MLNWFTGLILVVSAILFISTFGIHIFITNQKDGNLYLLNPILTSIPWISGFVLPVIPFSIVFKFSWVAVFFINGFLVWLIGPWLTRKYLDWFLSGKGLGVDMVNTFKGGVIFLIIGLLIKYIL